MSYDTRFACCVVRSADARSMSSMLYDVSTGLSSCVGCGALGCERNHRAEICSVQVRAPFAGARVTSTRRDTSTRRAAHRTHRKSCVCTVFVRRSLIAAWFSLGSLCLYLYVRRTVLYLRRRTVAKVTDHHLPDETGLPIRASHLRAACSAHHHRHPRPPPTANHRYHHRSGASGSVPAR